MKLLAAVFAIGVSVGWAAGTNRQLERLCEQFPDEMTALSGEQCVFD